ncbi:MAG: RNA-directed DNA polymerase [Magnetococcus sp. YQC-3]
MYDHSFSYSSLITIWRKADSRAIGEKSREEIIENAIKSANTVFFGNNPIETIRIKGKPVYILKNKANEIVVRKLAKNLRRITTPIQAYRNRIVCCLKLLLEEGVPYRLYRLDIESFYESFNMQNIVKIMDSNNDISPLSRRILLALLDYYRKIDGKGLPRGMAISAPISDMMMAEFDSKVLSEECVYFYARYVDDIVIMTSSNEKHNKFLELIDSFLPDGLCFNKNKQAVNEVKILKKCLGHMDFRVEYLGYSFKVTCNSLHIVKSRHVCVEISQNKIKKTKTKIVRAFLDFHRTHDSRLLIDRMKYLTSNYKLVDWNTGKHQLAGVYYNSPALSPESKSLKQLDGFLRDVLFSSVGRLSSLLPKFQSNLKRKILCNKFEYGFTKKRFVHFSNTRIQKILECWKYV